MYDLIHKLRKSGCGEVSQGSVTPLPLLPLHSDMGTESILHIWWGRSTRNGGGLFYYLQDGQQLILHLFSFFLSPPLISSCELQPTTLLQKWFWVRPVFNLYFYLFLLICSSEFSTEGQTIFTKNLFFLFQCFRY